MSGGTRRTPDESAPRIGAGDVHGPDSALYDRVAQAANDLPLPPVDDALEQRLLAVFRDHVEEARSAVASPLARARAAARWVATVMLDDSSGLVGVRGGAMTRPWSRVFVSEVADVVVEWHATATGTRLSGQLLADEALSAGGATVVQATGTVPMEVGAQGEFACVFDEGPVAIQFAFDAGVLLVELDDPEPVRAHPGDRDAPGRGAT